MNQFDVIIIGAGAGGLSAAQYSARANLSTLVLDSDGPGGQSLLIDRLENYPGFPDPIGGEEFTERFEQQAKNFGAIIRTEGVTAVHRETDGFTVSGEEETYRATAVILATGAAHRKLGVSGEAEFQGRGVSYCATCDGPMFAGKRLLVVGGGDAACDEARFLTKLTDEVVVVHRRERFRAQKSLAERVLHDPKIDVRFHTVVEAIHGSPNEYGIDAVSSVTLRNTVDGRSWTEEFGAVFVFVGSVPRSELVPFADRDDAGYIRTDERMATNVPGLFAVGDVRTTVFRQLIVAASDGAIAAHTAGEYIDELRGNSYRSH